MRRETAFRILVIVFMAVISSSSLLAVPMPHGVDGAVLDLNGNETSASILFLNTANNFSVNGTTGMGHHKGRFSAAIKGEDGDELIIRVWNAWHERTVNMTLEGSSHGVIIYLNATPPSNSSSPSHAPSRSSAYRSLKSHVSSVKPSSTVRAFKGNPSGVAIKVKSPSKKINRLVVENVRTGEEFTLYGGGPSRDVFSGVIDAKSGDELKVKVSSASYAVKNPGDLELSLSYNPRKHTLKEIRKGVSSLRTLLYYSIILLAFSLLVLLVILEFERYNKHKRGR